MRFLHPWPVLLSLLLLCLDNNHHTQGQPSDDAGLLGPDFALPLGNGVILTTSLAESIDSCQMPYRVLRICLRSECRDFANVCPTNATTTGSQQNTGLLTCAGIAETICTTYENCCMTYCALELQTLAICVGENSNNGNNNDDPKGLACQEPSCNDIIQNATTTEAPATNPDTSIIQNTTMTTEAPITNTNLRECELVDEGDIGPHQYFCQHFSNLTSNNDPTNTKFLEAAIVCTLPTSSVGSFDHKNDCQCLGATVFGDIIQACDCQVCDSSTSDDFVVALDCSNNTQDPFVIDDCVGQTCQGECIRMSDVPSVTPTAAASSAEPSQTTITVPPTVNPTSPMPSTAPSIQATTAAPTIVTELPTIGSTGSPTSGATIVAPPQSSSIIVLTNHPSSRPSAIPSTVLTTNQPSIAPSVAPTTVGPSTLRPTAVPTVAPSTMPPTTSPQTVLPTMTPPPPTLSPIRQHSVLVSLVGALLTTIGLIIVLVVTKKGDFSELTRVERRPGSSSSNMPGPPVVATPTSEVISPRSVPTTPPSTPASAESHALLQSDAHDKGLV
ncbi:expressed unknown protein [Seminavis robusta]|uniref:Uncharacterized protein n=1 Tax=Seminavis robusta TaxID=568900 RepID=A0A9N8DKS4_9STRA|nr:expressed unknown protein [Seminavis robusta]|eukprot:Sro176_g077450.1 n/a (557) ;mRNA; f:64097-65767